MFLDIFSDLERLFIGHLTRKSNLIITITMKKTLLTTITTIALPLIASAHCGDCKADAHAKAAGEKAECAKKKCSPEDCSKKLSTQLQEAFQKHDKDQDGKLDQAEFKALVETVMAKGCPSKCKK